ncbi:C-terminal processing protease CtpA/Prc [Fontibacillus phaseoli]|uniref:C-terminal processing protease CtpA/Prc n=1 Tax=Fontibacillus phaseoli TaxID=1416533 RepID=A0A369ATY1_9BACL|nr:S41 family peptidase [Fontibacillus phaseoli]RCX12681.1 C-terminal processing protease CtpA/Prc [Fontibacillus phaseoli]
MKKTMLRTATFFLVMLAGIMLFLFYPDKNSPTPGKVAVSIEPSESTEPISSNLPADAPATMTVQAMTEDLDYLVKTMEEVHPALMKGWNKEQQETIDEAYKQIQSPLSKESFYFSANKIVALAHDAHTTISPLSDNTEILYFPLYWAQEGPVVLNSTLELQRGDLLVKLGELTIEELLEKLTQVVPAENEYWIKTVGISMLMNGAFLRESNLVKDGKVPITIERNGELVQLDLPLVPLKSANPSQTPYDTGRENYSYIFNEELSLGILRINTCKVDQNYLNTLKDFFSEVASLKIKHVAVDLRNNSGGDSKVTDEFLRYIGGVKKYASYSGLVRYSLQAAEQRGESQTSGYSSSDSSYQEISHPATPSFTGDIYVLTSPRTFSSGNWFAVIIQDNKLGTILGEPTGNQPSSYGDVLGFSLPHSGFQFNVSYKKFKRPDSKLDDQTALMPDVPVYTTRQDIIDSRDAQIGKLEEIIKKKP